MLSSDPETPFQIPDGLTLDDLLDTAERAVIDRVRLGTNRHDPAAWAAGVLDRADADHAAGHMDDDTHRHYKALAFLVPLDNRLFPWVIRQAKARVAA